MERLREQEIAQLAQRIGFPPLKIIRWEDQPNPGLIGLGSYRNYRPDALLEIGWENKSYLFLAEIKGISSPSILVQASYQIKTLVAKVNEDRGNRFYPLVIAPYLSEAQLTSFAESGISALDLSGNGAVIVPGKIFVYRTGASNKFPSNAPIKNVFRGNSSIVPRAFFARKSYASVSDVWNEVSARSGKITIATVSKVLKALEDELLILRDDGFRLVDGRGLLEKLRENYRRPAKKSAILGKVSDVKMACAHLTENAERQNILCAIDEPNRYALMPSTSGITRMYTEDINKILSEIDFAVTDRFANLELIETKEQAIYFDRRQESSYGDVFFTSPLQVYLELATSGKRERETAEQIAEGLLSFKY